MTPLLPFLDTTAPPLHSLDMALYRRARIEVALLRLDAIHPAVSGNKAYKLKYALMQALDRGQTRLLSFGGAYSNHIHALAFAGRALGLETVGVIRGEPAYAANPTLTDAANWGMRLHFVDRETYRRQRESAFLRELEARFGAFALIPEGGGGVAGLAGCREILAGCPQEERFDLICSAAGTGTTLAGLIAARAGKGRILGFPVLGNAGFLVDDIRGLLLAGGLSDPGNWRLDLEAHEGGYGRVTPRLAAFIAAFEAETGVVLDPVYTGKMLLGFHQRVADGAVAPGSRVLLIHTGGLQGLRGMEKTLYDRRIAFRGRLPL